MGIIKYFIKNPLILNLLTFFIIIVGIVSMTNLQREDFPSIDFETVLVTVPYRGALPNDVENNLAIPMEREIRSVEGVKDIVATSIKGLLTIRVKVEPEYDTSNVADDIKKALDQVPDYPVEAEKPVITEIDSKRRGVISVAVFGEDYTQIQKEVKNFRNYIEEKRYLSKANLSGYRDYNYIINVDPDKLREYDISLTEVKAALSNRNLNIGGGNFLKDKKEVNIRIDGEFKTQEDISNLMVRSNFSGRGVFLKDIATIEYGFLDKDSFERINGKAGVVLSLVLKEQADIISSIEDIKNSTDNYFNNRNIDYVYLDDLSYYVKRRLNVLTENAMLGFGLVIISLIVFLNFKTAVFASLGAPISFFGAFILMDIFGISLNLISMFGLILVLGMLVDDAIVLAEKFYQYLEKGEEKQEAALLAVKDTIGPITATILTTMIAFSSMFFMGGIMGKFLWTVPIVVIFCLTISWIECFFILSNHLADFGTLADSENFVKTALNRFKDWYANVIRFFLKSSFLVVLSFFILFISSLWLGSQMRFELFPGDDIRVVTIQIEDEKGVSILKTLDNIKRLENDILSVLKEEEYLSIRSWLGRQVTRDRSSIGSHLASLKIEFSDFSQRERDVNDILIEIESKVKEYDFQVDIEKIKGGPPVGKDVDIKISGYELEDMYEYSKEVKKYLDSLDIISSDIDYDPEIEEYIINIDEKNAQRLGLSTRLISAEIRSAFSEERVSDLLEEDETVDIILRLNPNSNDFNTLKNLTIPNRTGNYIPLYKAVKFNKVKTSDAIVRKNYKKTIAITAAINKRKTTSLDINKKLEEYILKTKPDDIFYALEGENEDTKESLNNFLKAGGMAFTAIFFLLVVIFRSLVQPFIIMTAIPLGIMGVIWTFKIAQFVSSGWALGFMAIMGVIGLNGVVVNDSIVLVDTINKNLDKDYLEEVVESSKSRVRAVILTTFTTVMGLAPLAFSPNGDPFLRPMALSFAGGLFFASIITLVFVPALYYSILRIKVRFNKD